MNSEQTNEINAALAKAQGEIKNPAKNHTNPHFKTKYADLTDGLDVIRPTLSKHGIAIIQMTDVVDGFVVVFTRLAHTSGQYYESRYPVDVAGNHQKLGGSLTYAKRQALFAICGVAGDDDSDGNEATEATPAKNPAALVESVEYVVRAELGMADIDSIDRLNAWWKAEATNREYHFKGNREDPLYLRLVKARNDRGDAIAAADKAAA